MYDDSDSEFILVENSKDFILFTIRRFFDDKDIERELFKKYKPSFDLRISKVKKLNRMDTIRSIHFRYMNQKLYFINDKVTKESVVLYNKVMKPNETIDKQKERVEILLQCLIEDLKSIVYNHGYYLILNKMKEFVKTHDWDIEFIPHYFALGKLYGKKLDHVLNNIYIYRDLLEENVKGFSFAEWDKERALEDIKTLDIKTIEAFNNVSSKKEEDIAAFLRSYFEWAIILSEKTCNDLANLVKDNNIKFN